VSSSAKAPIGELRGLQVDLGIQASTDPHDRFFSKELGGGALFDLGVYAVSFAQMLFGDESEISVQGSLAPTGVDAEAALILGYPGGRRAQITVSLLTATPGAARIFGSDGYLDVLPRFHHPNDLVLHRRGRSPEALAVPARGQGYVHELEHVTQAVLRGSRESDVMPLADTLAVMRVLGRACEQLGIVHHEAGP
jgi:predicted dehydrogenase